MRPRLERRLERDALRDALRADLLAATFDLRHLLVTASKTFPLDIHLERLTARVKRLRDLDFFAEDFLCFTILLYGKRKILNKKNILSLFKILF